MGESEAIVRLPGLLLSLGALLLVWDMVDRRAGPAAAALTGVLLGLSVLWLVYGIQSTMYPFAAFFAALAVHADSQGRDAATKFALSCLALTHLFGFVFLVLWLWRRPGWRRHALHTLLPWIWLVGSTIAVLAVRNDAGPGLGPAWQAARGFELVYDLTQDRAAALHHSFAFLLAILLLNPILMEHAWFGAQRKSHWGIGLAALTAFLFTGPSFLRFAVPLQPVAFLIGFPRPEHEPLLARRSVLAILIALASLTSATAYVNSGLDAGVQNDVPGLVDWRQAAAVAASSETSRLVASASPPLAFYLERNHGFHVGSSADAPNRIPMERPDGRTIEVTLANGAASYRAAALDGALLVVLDTQTGTLAALFQADYVVCGSVQGAHILAAQGDCPA
jgi:hypothetical protein